MSKKTKLSTENYKGVRDFYPEDQQLQNYLKSKLKATVENFGYENYDASPLEYTEIYKAKSGQEIATDQTYTFKDKGGRTVSLRPEMTPTIARMIAKKVRELNFPIRWYSFNNIFRYESPQKGRLREHYQLNVDIFGGVIREADTEMIYIIHQIMKDLGVTKNNFSIKINSREILNSIYDNYKISEKARPQISKLLDKKDKISKEELSQSLEEYFKKVQAKEFLDVFSSTNNVVDLISQNHPALKQINEIIKDLNKNNINNVVFEPALVRGFDYYTGLVFEVFDIDPVNSRAIFGGGRYDSLISVFSDRNIPAVGFGLGDVRLLEFLKNQSLLPKYKPRTQVIICKTNNNFNYNELTKVANFFRDQNIATEIDISGKKLKDQISRADKKNIPFIVISGDEEKEKNIIKVKKLQTKEEVELKLKEAVNWIKNNLNT
jgi:histidyl-tRNA synthetase